MSISRLANFNDLKLVRGEITPQLYGAVGDGVTDDTTALQNAINAAVAAGMPLVMPGLKYAFTPPLTVGGNLTFIGVWASGNWNSGINVPLGTPPLVGAVLYPASNGQHAVVASTAGLQINFINVNILFQTPFVGTGDGFNYIPSGTGQGLSGSFWQNFVVYGHDGDHYGFNLQNPIYGKWDNVGAFGGGTLKMHGSSSSGNYGNLTISQLFGQVVVGGAAHGIALTASASQRLNLITFIRPQVITDSIPGVSPGGNPPTSAQKPWSLDANVTNIKIVGADFETNVSSRLTLGAPGKGNDMDIASWFDSAAGIDSPQWGINGVAYGPVTRIFNDTTSSGTVANMGIYAIPGNTVRCTSAATFTNGANLYVGGIIASTNATITRNSSILANGSITALTGTLNALAGGVFATGATQINTNGSTATTQLGDGTTSGAVTIGGASNTTTLGSSSVVMGGGPLMLKSYTVGTVPSAATFIRGQIYVSDEAGGASPAFSDGTNWRRYSDRAIIS